MLTWRPAILGSCLVLLALPIGCTGTGGVAVTCRASKLPKGEGVRIDWSIVNNTETEVWVPVRCGYNVPDHSLPHAFITPGNTLVLVSGLFLDPEGANVIHEGTLRALLRRIEPRETFAGSVRLPFPFVYGDSGQRRPDGPVIHPNVFVPTEHRDFIMHDEERVSPKSIRRVQMVVEVFSLPRAVSETLETPEGGPSQKYRLVGDYMQVTPEYIRQITDTPQAYGRYAGRCITEFEFPNAPCPIKSFAAWSCSPFYTVDIPVRNHPETLGLSRRTTR